MSLQTIIADSSREILSEMLAADVADQLAQRIVERTMARVDEAVGDFFGLEPGREGLGKRRAGKAKSNGRIRATDSDNVEIGDSPQTESDAREHGESSEAAA